jgi:hypothetical protein
MYVGTGPDAPVSDPSYGTGSKFEIGAATTILN